MNWYKKSQYLDEELQVELPSTTLSGTYYHGSLTDPKDIFTELREDYSEWEAIWVTDEENIAEEYATGYYEKDEDRVPIVFRVEINLKKAAQIIDRSYEWEEFKELHGINDPREAIPYLRQLGYDGWETLGSIGYNQYNDIAIFGGEARITHSKIYQNDEWSDWAEI